MVSSTDCQLGRRPLDRAADSAVVEDGLRADFGDSLGFAFGYVRFPSPF